MTPTPSQQLVIDRFNATQNVVFDGSRATGKTTALAMALADRAKSPPSPANFMVLSEYPQLTAMAVLQAITAQGMSGTLSNAGLCWSNYAGDLTITFRTPGYNLLGYPPFDVVACDMCTKLSDFDGVPTDRRTKFLVGVQVGESPSLPPHSSALDVVHIDTNSWYSLSPGTLYLPDGDAEVPSTLKSPDTTAVKAQTVLPGWYAGAAIGHGAKSSGKTYHIVYVNPSGTEIHWSDTKGGETVGVSKQGKEPEVIGPQAYEYGSID